MKEHILLEKSHKYNYLEKELKPENCTFNSEKGYWVEISSGGPMMLGKNPKKPQTKKEDRETGEDQKGE